MRMTPALRKSETASPAFPAFPRLFEELFRDWPFRTFGYERSEAWRPAVDIYETDGTLVLRCEVPGVAEKEIEVKLEGNVLTIKGERKLEHEPEAASYYQLETFHGSFSRSFTLPETVDVQRIKADYRNGILTITVPQRPEVQPRAIPVSVH